MPSTSRVWVRGGRASANVLPLTGTRWDAPATSTSVNSCSPMPPAWISTSRRFRRAYVHHGQFGPVVAQPRHQRGHVGRKSRTMALGVEVPQSRDQQAPVVVGEGGT